MNFYILVFYSSIVIIFFGAKWFHLWLLVNFPIDSCIFLIQLNLWQLLCFLTQDVPCSSCTFCLDLELSFFFEDPWFLSDTFFKHCVCCFTNIFMFMFLEKTWWSYIARISLHVLVELALQHANNFTIITKSKIF